MCVSLSLRRSHEAVTSRIAATGHHAGRRIDRDAMHAADRGCPRLGRLGCMAAVAQSRDGVSENARFHLHLPPIKQPPARLLDRILDAQTEIDVLDQRLRLRLANAV